MPAPSPGRLFLWFLFLSALVFLRPPTTNFIFDEQEALLGNPYLNGPSAWLDAFRVDFWGRVPTRTIGAYRPLPNLLWWPLRTTLGWGTPWVLCLLNLCLHAATGALLALSLVKLLEDRGSSCAWPSTIAWAVGAWFVVSGTSTEAVCSVVGLADLLVGFFLAAQLLLLSTWGVSRRKGHIGGVAAVVFASTFLGLLSKETMIASLLWVPVMSFLVGPQAGEMRLRLVSCATTTAAAFAALGLFVVLRMSCYPAETAEVASFVRMGSEGVMDGFFSWFRQPKMPVEPLNNPLLSASSEERWATGLRLAFEQFRQILAPWGLNADHSFPRETVTGWGWKAWLGALVLLVAVGAIVLETWRTFVGGVRSARSLLLAGGAAVFVGSYLPISNLLVLLPTIRGDRLLYSPTLGIALVLAGFSSALDLRRRLVLAGGCAYLGFHALVGRAHALDYRDDVSFWRATSDGDPASAKSHLNLGVMLGARGDEAGRLLLTRRAVRLAPEWPMGRVYLGDVHCRLGDLDAAWTHFREGFSQAPNSKALTALGLQCLWDRGGFSKNRASLLDLAADHPGTWLDYFVTELDARGTEHRGIPEEYRPRKYNARAQIR